MSVRGKRARKSSAAGAAFSLLLTVVALALPLAGTAQAVLCAQTDVTSVTLTPSTDTNQLAGANEQHTVTATATKPDGPDAGTDPDPCEGVTIDFQIDDGSINDEAGADPDADHVETPTNANGQATYTYGEADDTQANETGTDTLRAWVEDTDDDLPNGPQDTATKEWYTQAQAGSTIDCEPETDTNPQGANHVVSCRVLDAEGFAFTTAQTVMSENQNDANDPDDANNNAPDYQCAVAAAGANAAPDATVDGSGPGECSFNVSGAENETGTASLANYHDQDASGGFTASDPLDHTSKTWQTRVATTIDCTPETDTNPPGAQHTVTCNVDDQFGANVTGAIVDFEFLTGSPNDPQGDGSSAPNDASATTDGAGNATLTYQGNNPGTDQICGWIDANNNTDFNEGLNNCTEDANTDQVAKTWSTGQEQALDCSPENDANHNTLTHQITCQLGTATAGVEVKAEATGANDPDGANPSATPDFTCTTNGAGNCSFTHDPANNNNGATTYRIWVGNAPDATEGVNEVNNPGTNFNEPDNTDVVMKTWHGVATTLTQTPESDSAALGTCNVFTVTMTDAGQLPVGNVVLDVLQTHANFNNGNNTDDADLRFCTQGEVQTADPSAPNPSNVTETGPGNTGQVHGHTDEDTDANGQVSYGVFVDNNVQGNVQVLAYCDNTQLECPNEDNDNAPDPSELQDVSTKTWGGGGADAVETVACTPESDTNPNGTTHNFLCTLTNANNSPVPGVTPVGDVTAGPNANEAGAAITCGASNQQGVSACAYNDSGASPVGTDTIEVWVQQSAVAGGGTAARDAGEPFDSISKTWATPPTGLGINVTCDDTNGPTGGQGDAGNVANENNNDCTNPVTAGNETFTATVFNPNGNADPTDDTVVEGVQVSFAITGEGPADIGFNPPGGGSNGPVFCTTAANGSCSVTVTNPTPTSGDFVHVQGTVFGQTAAGFGNNSDTASKSWVEEDEAVTVILTPQGDTNQTGTSHTYTVTVLNVFNQPLAGRNVDLDILPGSRNDNGSGTVEGKDLITNASGQATFTYNDAGPLGTDGQDNVRAWHDDDPEDDIFGNSEPAVSDTAVKFWRTQLPTTTNVKLDMELGGAGCPTAFTPDDDPGTTGTDEGWTADAQPNQINQPHQVCAAAFDENNNIIVAGEITFTIQGQGFFTNGSGANLGTTISVPVNQQGQAFALVNSTQTGNSAVTATKDGKSDTGNKPWFNLPPRTLDCDPETGTNEPGEDHEVLCTALDRQGNPVVGWRVWATETGTGTLDPTGSFSCDPLVTGAANTCIQLTDNNGVARFVLTSNAEGTQSLLAELADNNNGNRASATAGVDECERPANNPAGAPAGVCTDQVEKTWDDVEPECSDGVDNDGDGFIDEDDPRCLDPQGNYDPDDDSEAPVDDVVADGPCTGHAIGSSSPNPNSAGQIIVGTNGDDLITGTDGDDIICGLDGDDVISSGNGDDIVVGNNDDDTVNGGGGKDQLRGNAGNDAVSGKGSNDTVLGGGGNDTLKGNKGFDTLKGQGGNDTVQGGEGQDIVVGNEGNDTLKGWTEVDNLKGGPGDDTCDGGPPKGDGDTFSGCESKTNG